MAALPGVTVKNGVVTKIDLSRTGVMDAGASALGAGLKDSKLETLSLSECFVFCSERCRYPAVMKVTIYIADVAPYLSLIVHFFRGFQTGTTLAMLGQAPLLAP